MGVIRFCQICDGDGCLLCKPSPQEILQMRQDALESLSGGSGNVSDLVAKRAAKSGVYSTDNSRNKQPHKQPRKVDADCAYCHERSVIDLDECGYYCTQCWKRQPIEFTECVFCEREMAVKQIDSHTCILCKKDQPTESNVLIFR